MKASAGTPCQLSLYPLRPYFEPYAYAWHHHESWTTFYPNMLLPEMDDDQDKNSKKEVLSALAKDCTKAAPEVASERTSTPTSKGESTSISRWRQGVDASSACTCWCLYVCKPSPRLDPPLSQNDAWYLRQTIEDPGFWHVRLGILGGVQLVMCESKEMNGCRWKRI